MMMPRTTHLLLVAASLTSLLLTACAREVITYPTEVLPPPNLQATGDKATIVTVRVVLQFNTANQAFNDEAFVTALQVQAQVPMHYVAAVSADTHVYGLELPASQSPSGAVQRLQALPSVSRVELDSRVKAQ